jgi:hypothetical protein
MHKFKVTKKNIKKGRRRDHARCPVALAIRDKGYTRVSVGFSLMSFYNSKTKEWFYYKPTIKSDNFIRKFDIYKEVKPTSLTFNKRID